MSKPKEWVEFYDNYNPPKEHRIRKSDIVHFYNDRGGRYAIQGLGSYHIPVTKETWDRIYQEVQEIS